MKALTFRARLTLRWTLAFGLLLALLTLGIYVAARTYIQSSLEAQLLTLASTEAASSLDEGRPVHIHEFPLGPIAGSLHAEKFVQVLTLDGRVVLQSSGLGDRTPLIDVATRRRVQRGDVLLLPVTVSGRPARMTGLLVRRGSEAYIVVVGVYTEPFEATLRHLRWLLAIGWIVGVLVTGCVGFVISSRALAPVDRIAGRAAAIARGDFSARLDPPQHDDEIGRMTRLLNEMLDRLHAALEANRQFAADASHELRGPLTAIIGEVDVSLRRERPAREYRETLDVVRQRADELSRLTENLMLLVRAREGNAAAPASEVALGPLIRESVRRTAWAASERHVQVRFERFPDVVVYAEPGLLGRVFDNLVQNAVQYDRTGGTVVVTADVEAPPTTGWTSSTVVVRIADTGSGIPQADHERIFERFYRVDPSRSRRTGGSGLGLSICREVLAVFRGSVRVASSSPEGTVMEVRLPGARASAKVTNDPPFDEASPTSV